MAVPVRRSNGTTYEVELELWAAALTRRSGAAPTPAPPSFALGPAAQSCLRAMAWASSYFDIDERPLTPSRLARS